MSVVSPPDDDLVTLIRQYTGRPTSLLEVQPDAVKPYYLVTPLPTQDFTGSMSEPSSMAELLYQIDVVGINPDQLGAAESRLLQALAEGWATMPTLMGPVAIRRQGKSREDDKTYKATYTITAMVGA